MSFLISPLKFKALMCEFMYPRRVPTKLKLVRIQDTHLSNIDIHIINQIDSFTFMPLVLLCMINQRMLLLQRRKMF